MKIKEKWFSEGKNLQAQYERWQPRAKYKVTLDPTMEQVRKVCLALRRTAKVKSTDLIFWIVFPGRTCFVSLQRTWCAETDQQWRDLGF